MQPMPATRMLALAAAAAVAAVLLAACSPLGTLNALTPSGSYRKSAGISYGDDARNASVYFCEPVTDLPDKPAAIARLVHDRLQEAVDGAVAYGRR